MKVIVRCNLCNETKPATEENFYRHRDGSFYSPCRPCFRAKQKARQDVKRALNPKLPKPQPSEGCKICPKCQEDLPLERFRLAIVHGQPRRQSWCTSCENIAASLRRKTPEGRARSRLERRKRYAANPEKGREQARAARVKNHARFLQLSREQYRKHRLKRIADSHNRRALVAKLQEAGEIITDQEIAAQYRKQEYKCYYCGVRVGWGSGVKSHVDHYIPLSRGGRNLASNIVIACESCNLRKGAKLPCEFHSNILIEKA